MWFIPENDVRAIAACAAYFAGVRLGVVTQVELSESTGMKKKILNRFTPSASESSGSESDAATVVCPPAPVGPAAFMIKTISAFGQLQTWARATRSTAWQRLQEVQRSYN